MGGVLVVLTKWLTHLELLTLIVSLAEAVLALWQQEDPTAVNIPPRARDCTRAGQRLRAHWVDSRSPDHIDNLVVPLKLLSHKWRWTGAGTRSTLISVWP